MTLLEGIVILKAQLKRGLDAWTPELEQPIVKASYKVYISLHKRSNREEEMGVFQLLDILEDRMVGIAQERRERAELEERQAVTENHPLLIKRPSSVNREKVSAG